MKSTPFTTTHQFLGAKMAEFAGYNMPISYTGITDEHLCVRQKAGIFDVSHMGQFIVRGNAAAALLQRLSSNDVAKLYPGKVQYACLMNYNGGIVDDMLVYKLPNDNAYMLVVNAANIEKDWNWVVSENKEGAELIDISDQTALLAVQGPQAAQLLQPLTNINLPQMAYYTFEKGTFAGIPNVLVSATGYTGAGGFEIYFDNKDAATMWERIMEAGKPFGLQPAGLGARDTLRLEKGYCLYGNDIDDTTTPLEAGLGWVTKLKTDVPFIGRNVLETQQQNGLTRKLAGFELVQKGIARHHCPITTPEGRVIGVVTSGTFSPSLQKAIGMGYIETAYAKPGSSVSIDIRGKLTPALVVKMPFL
ncbi:glycine cleavage system protein T [Sphingobacteriales bacterium UPWRP_1]|nr:glycine cleavage system protein T [Sphingobacteriales bacterium TSM_CSM]PSJ75902.1 glycine cleavage system protein T [Sphingobacteriales bacterium UPWRP_1]